MAFLLAMALFAAQAEPAEPIYSPRPEAVQELHRAAGCIVRERTPRGPCRARDGFPDAGLSPSSPVAVEVDRRLLSSRTGWRWAACRSPAALPSISSCAVMPTRHPSALVAAEFPRPRSRSEALSYCVVQRAPAESRAVLDTAVTSPEEAAALNALRPAIAGCLEGQEQAQLNRLGLRSLIAIALYHLGRRSAG